MTVLILIGLVLACAKMWFEVGALRSRISDLEAGTISPWREEIVPVSGPPAVARVVSTPPTAVMYTPPVLEPELVSGSIPDPEPIEEYEPAPVPTPDEPPYPEPARGFGFEDLFGRRLPIWAGGVTLAVAGFLIVKYSIDAGLLRPIVRVIFGLLFGSALIAGAELALREDARVRDPRVRQALSGAGIATLYASILVAANLYHLIAPITAFVGMALTTLLAGGLSLRFGAPSAVLGLLGGLAAPMLVGSGPPDVPLLSAYLALTVGGLCALSRKQQWMWLGVLALIGGFGWGALLILSGALDFASTLSVGVFTLLLGIALPLFAFKGQQSNLVRMAGSLLSCAQLAALVATGGFAPLVWGLYGLVSVAVIWLSRREAGLAHVPSAALTIALLLATAWPRPEVAMVATVLAGIAAIFGLPVIQRMWRGVGVSGAIQLSAIAVALVALPALHLDIASSTVALLAMLGAVLTGGVAAVGWSSPDRDADARFAILVTTAAALLATAAIVISPEWLIPPALAILAAGLVMLGERARDRRIDWIAAAFAGVALFAVIMAPQAQFARATGVNGSDASLSALLRWFAPALVAALFAWRSRLPKAAWVAQPVTVVLAYMAIAQVVPTHFLALIPVLMVAGLAVTQRCAPAIIAAGVLTALWASIPLGTWIASAVSAVLGSPMLISGLPSLDDTVLRLLMPAAAAAIVAWRQTAQPLRLIATIAATACAIIAAHVFYKHIFSIADADAFIRLGMAERTVWEGLLVALAAMLWRRTQLAGIVVAAAGLAHFVGFTLLLHNPLWSEQAVGNWPIANLLLPAFGLAFAVTLAARRLALPTLAMRALAILQMVLITVFAAATLRQAFHGSVLIGRGLDASEDIARSVLLIVVAIGFLRHGIVAAAQEWRVASLVLMLAAVAKVFLVDAAGLDGLLRIASFAALGFSLIGIGWLYARYLPADRELTGDSRMSATSSTA